MKPYILVVDDEPDMQNLIRFHLKNAGYSTDGAASGREALECISLRRPDLMLLDLMLPDIDGFGVCEILRNNPSTAALPIIIVSAWGDRESLGLGKDYGALGFVTKPFKMQHLVERIQTLLPAAQPV